MYDDVSVSPDGRCEVGVARDVEGIVSEPRLLLHHPSTEILSQLHTHLDTHQYSIHSIGTV